jgi:hypothetical protein
MDSSLIGFYALISYSYSQRHTYLTLGIWERDIGALITGYRGKQKKSNIFTIWTASDGSFPHSICFSNTNST